MEGNVNENDMYDNDSPFSKMFKDFNLINERFEKFNKLSMK